MKCKTFLRRLAATCCVLALLITSAAALSVEDARALLEEDPQLAGHPALMRQVQRLFAGSGTLN